MKITSATAKGGCVLDILVRCNKKEFRVVGADPWRDALQVEVQSAPNRGKANREIEQGLSVYFSALVSIESGHGSKRKRIRINAPKEEVAQKVRAATGSTSAKSA